MSPDGLKLVWVARREAHPRSREGARALTNEGCATRRAIPLAFGEGQDGESDDGPTRGLDQRIRVMTLGCLKSEYENTVVRRLSSRTRARGKRQCASTCASLITPPQTSVSLLMKAAASAGEPPAARRLIFAKWSCASGLWSTSFTALLSFVIIAPGVFGGATSAFQVPDSKPFTPASSSVWMSGRLGIRLSVATARIRALSAWCSLIAEASSMKMKSTWLAIMSFSAGAVPL